MPVESIRTWGGYKVQINIPSIDMAIQEIPSPRKVIIPLGDKNGHECRALVQVGENVFMGETIARDESYKITPVHSPVSGKVVDIGRMRFTELGSMPCITIESDGNDNYHPELHAIENFLEQEPLTLVKVIREGGVKLIPFETLPDNEREGSKITLIKHFVINAIGHGFSGIRTLRLLMERMEDFKTGVQLIEKIWAPEKIYLVIDERNKDLKEKIGNLKSLELVSIPTKYPIGYPHLLFKQLFNKEIPSPGGKAIDFGVAFSGVDTLLHAVDAVIKGRPMMDRYVTVSGSVMDEALNIKVRIGTPIRTILEVLNISEKKIGKVIFGNPLDGVAQISLENPIQKDTRWIWLQAEEEVNQEEPYRACINCGDCVDVCPMRLMPNMLGRYCESYRFDDAADMYDLFTCIECGLCGYVCPSRRPLVHFIKHAKHELMMREKENEH